VRSATQPAVLSLDTELVELSGMKIHGCLSCRKCSARHDGLCAQSDDMGNILIEKMALGRRHPVRVISAAMAIYR
jgi:multimeric flavodoxin WrbA